MSTSISFPEMIITSLLSSSEKVGNGPDYFGGMGGGGVGVLWLLES